MTRHELQSFPAHASQDKPGPSDADYWHGLVDEREGALFLDLTPRTMQAMRQRGDGPEFVRISSRCIKYRRIGLKAWADAKVRTSTSDPGQAADRPERRHDGRSPPQTEKTVGSRDGPPQEAA